MTKNNNRRGYPSIALLNSEGDILVAYKTPGDYMIMDQWGICVDILTQKDFTAFIDGTYDITDSKNKIWNYVKSHKNMKPSAEKLETFLTIIVKEQE